MQESYIARAHPCFRLDVRFPICVDDQSLMQDKEFLLDLWQGHSYRVMSNPSDLLAHTRRIRLCHEPELNDRLIGALLDLDHVLGSNGGKLLERLRIEALAVLDSINPPENNPVLAKGRVLPTITQLLKAGKLEESPEFP